MPDEIVEILFSEDQIRTRVQDLGIQIAEDYKNRQLVFVSVLRGSVFFATDLARKVDLPLSMDFLSISSYGEGSEGVVRLIDDHRPTQAATLAPQTIAAYRQYTAAGGPDVLRLSQDMTELQKQLSSTQVG